MSSEVYEVQRKGGSAPFLALGPIEQWPPAHFTATRYTSPVVFLVNDTNERDYYGRTELVSAHRTYDGAYRELELLKATNDDGDDLELAVTYLKD